MRNRVSAYESAESVGKGKDDWCTKLSGFCLSGCSPSFIGLLCSSRFLTLAGKPGSALMKIGLAFP